MAIDPMEGTLPGLSYRDASSRPAERRRSVRILTWNCSSPAGLKGQEAAARRFAFYTSLLKKFDADIVLLQEAPDPGRDQSEDCWIFWRGLTPGRGIAVILDRQKYPWAEIRGSTRSGLLVRLGIPHDGNVLAIWSCPPRPSFQAYLEETRATLAIFESEILSAPTIIAGDFHSSAAWDSRTKGFSHSDLVASMEKDLKLRSAYHHHFSIASGDELHPTFHHYRHQDKPFHIDYCFLPRNWKIQDVQIGSFREWAVYSDHCPVVVDARPLPSAMPNVYI